MKSLRAFAIVAMIAATTVLQPSTNAAEPELPPLKVACGQNVTTSFRLTNPLTDCPGDGIVVGAPGITIDLGDQVVDGDATISPGDSGIDNSAEHDNVTVIGGVISGFQIGVVMTNVPGVTIRDVTVIGNQAQGVLVQGSDPAVVDHLTAVDNDGIGIQIGNSPVQLTNGRFFDNSQWGIKGVAITGAEIASNELAANGSGGIRIENTTGLTVSNNTSYTNGFDGISFSGSVGEITDNSLAGNGDDGVELTNSPASTIDGNTVRANRADGVDVNGASAGTIISNNFVTSSGNYGIVSVGDGNEISGNDVIENDLDGINASGNNLTIDKNQSHANGYNEYALTGTTNGQGFGVNLISGSATGTNKASFNDAATQCNDAALCPGQTNATEPSTLTECNADISGKRRIPNNIEDCPDDGLNVTASKVKLDLGFHRVTGDGDDLGIDAIDGFTGVKIVNGLVANFSECIGLEEAPKSLVSGTIVVACDTGIGVSSGAAIKIKNNRVGGNTVGIGLSSMGAKTKVSGNTVYANGDYGIEVFFSDKQKVGKNRTFGNNDAGVYVYFGEKNKVTGNEMVGDQIGIHQEGAASDAFNGFSGNTIRGARDRGIRNESVIGNKLTGNVITASFNVGIEIPASDPADQTAIKGNHVNGSGDIGVELSGADLVVGSNEFNRNGFHGLAIPLAAAVVSKNTTNENGFTNDPTGDGVGLGIYAPSSTGSGNKATGNDDSGECIPADLC